MLAARSVGQLPHHLGSTLRDASVRCHVKISDADLVQVYKQTRYVSGLRRIEGFELPVIEGISCGARPIVFDGEHYEWYDPWAIKIPEGTRHEVELALRRIFLSPYEPMDAADVGAVRYAFDWQRIISGFWERV